MRAYPGMRLAPNMGVPQLREELQRADTYLKQVSEALGRVAFAPQGSGPVGGNAGSTPDLTQFWYLPGRSPEQRAYGRNVLEGISVSAQGSGTPTVSQKLGIFAFDQNKGIPSVWLGVEGTDHALVNPGHANRPYHQNRYWVFPAFNQLSGGETNGLHYFADTSDYQVLANKTLQAWVLETSDITGMGIVESTNRGETESGTTKAVELLFHGSFPSISWKRSANSPSSGSYPAIAFPPLDVNTGVTAPTREKQHILCVMRKDHTDTTPFEDGGPLMGGGTGRELYPLFTSAQGTLAAPSDNVFPLWHPSATKSCDFVTSSASVTIASGTAGLYKGQRIRETIASYSLPEDVHVVSVDDGTHITMSAVWPGSNATRTVQFFGMTWSDSATSITLGAGVLADYLYLPGRAASQALAAAIPTGGSLYDFSMDGRLMVGDQTSFSTGCILDLSDTNLATAPPVAFVNIKATDTGTGAAAENLLGLSLVITDSNTFTSGSFTRGGLTITVGSSPATGVTAAASTLFNGTLTMSGGGTATNVIGGIWTVQGGTAGGPTITNLIGIQLKVGHRTSSVTTEKAISLEGVGAVVTGAVTDFIGIDFVSGLGNGANVATWHGIRQTAGPTSAIPNKWFFDLTSTASNLGNRILYKTAIGWNPSTVSAVAAMLHLGAGTTALAPFMLTSGTSLTTPLAGAIEMTTDDIFFTITTGPARKAFILDDGTRLTSGRVPFATTNGRLIDDSDMTFAVDTLTVTKAVIPTSIQVGGGAVITQFDANTYTPTLTNATNIAASTAFVTNYMRVGSMVTVSGVVAIDPTATGTIILGISLPIASNFAASEDCGGTAVCDTVAGQAAAIYADATNNRAQLVGVVPDAANRGWSFTFTYRII